MRKNFKEGDKILVIESEDQIILKKANSMDKQLAEDIEFARRTEEAWKEYEQGKFKSLPAEEFLKELKRW